MRHTILRSAFLTITMMGHLPAAVEQVAEDNANPPNIVLFKVDDWNEVAIICKGNHIQHYMNGRLILDCTDKHPERALLDGVLALQLHAGAPMWCEFKEVRIKAGE